MSKAEFSFNARDMFISVSVFVCLFVYFCWRIFALNLHARTTAPASRDLQENDIDVYVFLDLLATTVKKVTLKIREIDSFFIFLFFYFNLVVHCLEVQDSEAVVLMTQIKYGPLWWKTRMGAQLQISCSAVLHFFRMNSKGLKPPPLGVEFPFHFKHHPASFGLKSHPRIL